MLTAIVAAQGPSRIAMIVAPTACAVVPSGIGTLNIMIRKLNAAPTARSGTNRLLTIFPTRRTAAHQAGSMAAPNAAHVAGLR